MNKRMVHTILMTAAIGAVLLLLLKHFTAVQMAPTMPASEGLLGD